ncbi:ATP-binding protein [Candidatus Gracilibacteria bacterium 28_42_T64]|nr:ATP-binding protein [Candidatus Gracilibacteria bacterium 28_42_T64]
MENILKINHDFLSRRVIFSNNNSEIKRIVQHLNKDKLVIVSGIKNVGKTNIVKELLEKLGMSDNYFYFNKDLDNSNEIQSEEHLNNLYNTYVKLYKTPKIVILQNCTKVEGIKNFILKSYNNDLKVLLVGNTIKIGGKAEIEILPRTINNIKKYDLDIILKYGLLSEILVIQNIYLKEKFLSLVQNDIFTKDIFFNFGVKNLDLYKYTISYLSRNNTFFSLRELQKGLCKHMQISLKTTIDYIDYSLQAKIIKKVYTYDLKKSKEISSRVKYYFTDTGIRNSLNCYSLDRQILLENLIFNELRKKGYTVYNGLNGVFDFTFYTTSQYVSGLNLYIHMSEAKDKGQLKKEVNKLSKIKDKNKKYLIVESIPKLEIKKTNYDYVEIVEIDEFLRKLK